MMLNLQSSSLLNVTLMIIMILGVSLWIGHAQLVVCSSLLSPVNIDAYLLSIGYN
jgi:hypothetical protein